MRLSVVEAPCLFDLCKDAKQMEATLETLQPFAAFTDSSQGARKAGREKPCKRLPSSLLLLPFPEWSVSTGSAQDEMSYLRLILIS